MTSVWGTGGRRPGLAVITYDPRGGGVAYVARLLHAALTEINCNDPWSVTLDPGQEGKVSAFEAARFVVKLALGNVAAAQWVLFGHVGIASAQRLLPLLMRRPYAIQLHGTEVWDDHAKARDRAALRNATVCIAPSRYTALRARATHPTMAPIAVCPHGLLPARSDSHEAPDELLLARVHPVSALIVGRMLASEQRKGHDQLLECWQTVTANLPSAQLVIAGTGDDEPRLRRKARDLGLSHSVLFCGRVSDETREALLRRVAAYVMPSHQEGFGIVYVEAMRAGLPCIGAIDDGATEPIIDGVTGLLVEHSDVRAIGAAVLALLQSPSLRAALGTAARTRYEAEYTFDRYRHRLATVLSSAFGGAQTV